MSRALIALMVLTLTLAACGGIRDSRMNPRNWFGRSQAEPTLGPVHATEDRRPLVPSVRSVVIERTSTGAIVRAEAVMPTAGWFDAELVAEHNGRPRDGVLSYRFVAARPRESVAVAAQAPRTISAAAVISAYDLEEIREVVVISAETTHRARR